MHAQILQGENWTARKTDNMYIVSVKDHAAILNALTDFVVSREIKAGEISGIGAVSEATLRFFDPGTKKYVDKTFREQLEVTSLSGNISEVNGKPMLHMHITLGRSDYSALAGHLLDARIRGAAEFFIRPLHTRAVKVKDEEAGINFYDFTQE